MFCSHRNFYRRQVNNYLSHWYPIQLNKRRMEQLKDKAIRCVIHQSALRGLYINGIDQEDERGQRWSSAREIHCFLDERTDNSSSLGAFHGLVRFKTIILCHIGCDIDITPITYPKNYPPICAVEVGSAWLSFTLIYVGHENTTRLSQVNWIDPANHV